MLNKEQAEAAKPYDGISLVLAGPGTGKTKTLVEKVHNLLASGRYCSDDILVLTFNKQAAQEMRQRIQARCADYNAGQVLCTTFHSFCYRFLLSHPEVFLQETGYRTLPLVIDPIEKNKIMHQTIEKYLEDFVGLPVPIIAELITNQRFYEHSQKKLYSLGLDTSLRKVKEEYGNYKTEHSLIEFEDMINITVRILRAYPEVRKHIHDCYKYIIVDEYQDTSKNNFQLIQLLLDPQHPNLYVTGDDYQAIYAFRGTDPRYIVHFSNYFKNIQEVILYRNYRSRREIVRVSNMFIAHNRKQTSKKIVSVQGRGGTVRGHPVASFSEEITQLYMLLNKELGHHDDIVILYRNNFQADQIRTAFANHSWQKYLERVKLMTMHASKGLEFETVIITGISNAIIPSPDTDIEEERRLLYVALTRAKTRLYILYYVHEQEGKARFAIELGL